MQLINPNPIVFVTVLRNGNFCFTNHCNSRSWCSNILKLLYIFHPPIILFVFFLNPNHNRA
ncbi:hypothetical protein HanPSC8_Chr08g0315711 [Helianthus annuus]|nr:hypothetical protein HanPSC8_Chr08g0315711 [Helianthus annuus]